MAAHYARNFKLTHYLTPGSASLWICWRPGEMRITPAMAAGITPRLWTFNDLLA